MPWLLLKRWKLIERPLTSQADIMPVKEVI